MLEGVEPRTQTESKRYLIEKLLDPHLALAAPFVDQLELGLLGVIGGVESKLLLCRVAPLTAQQLLEPARRDAIAVDGQDAELGPVGEGGDVVAGWHRQRHY